MTFGKLSSITLDVDVKNGTTTVRKVFVGKAYGHVAQTTPYHGYWPTRLIVTSSLKNASQLQFQHGLTWSCTMDFQPMDPAAQASEILQCLKNLRNQETITVSVQDRSATTPTPSQADVITIV